MVVEAKRNCEDSVDLENASAASSSSGGEEDSQLEPLRKANKWRIWVGRIAVLIVVLAVTVTTYFLLRQQEAANFETAFLQFSRTLGDAALSRQKDLLDSLVALSSAISVYGATGGDSWPYVALPLFEHYAQDFKTISRAEYVGISNVVSYDNREEYLNFTSNNYQKWVQESHEVAYGNLDRLNQDSAKYNDYISMRTVDGRFVPDIERALYHVRTLQSPPMSAYGPTLNWNIASTHDAYIMAQHMKIKNETIFGNVRPFLALSPEDHKGFHDKDGEDHPHTFVHHHVPIEPKNYDSDIVATVIAAIAWDAPMLDLLPDNVHGIIAVIRNTCNQTYTYRVDGPHATYVGEGDYHSMGYDAMEVVVSLSLHKHPDFESVDGHCLYSMHIFPTAEFESSYHSRTPQLFASVVAVTFLLVASLFLVYDIIAEKKKAELELTAARSDAVVASLFPGEFREKILDHHDAATNNIYEDTEVLGEFNISRIYEKTTVCFADLVGFTKWSSSRTPADTFKLLETIFNAFDAAALRHGVFKVETIGDCYVAVTGLPKEQPDHAVRMARFARECMRQLRVHTTELVDSLGEDTADLGIRIGMHSGAVTGGVLRGQKSRFQLFGDTMNTASRMESTGLVDMIQLSEQTAQLLSARGKSSWCSLRENKIVAKGKGELQTYFLAERAALSRKSSSSFHSQEDGPIGAAAADYTYTEYDATNFTNSEDCFGRFCEHRSNPLKIAARKVVDESSSPGESGIITQASPPPIGFPTSSYNTPATSRPLTNVPSSDKEADVSSRNFFL